MDNERRILAAVRSKKNILVAPISLLALCLVASALSPVFLQAENISSLLKQTPIALVLGVGMTLVIITGGIDLSVGAIVGLSGVIMLQMRVVQQLPLGLSILIALLIGTLCGALNGLVVVLGKIPPFIVTLGTVGIFRSLCLILTGGVSSLSINRELDWVSNGTFLAIPYMFWFSVLFLLGGMYLLNFTRFGRHIYATGGNEESARYSGVSVGKTRFAAYLFNGLSAGLAAVLLVCRLTSCPPTAGDGYELNAIAAAVIGGTGLAGGEGGLFGTFIGVLIMAVIINMMNLLNINSFYQKAVIGAIIIVMVLIKNLGMKGAKE